MLRFPCNSGCRLRCQGACSSPLDWYSRGSGATPDGNSRLSRVGKDESTLVASIARSITGTRLQIVCGGSQTVRHLSVEQVLVGSTPTHHPNRGECKARSGLQTRIQPERYWTPLPIVVVVFDN